jgi:hypothetical protein
MMDNCKNDLKSKNDIQKFSVLIGAIATSIMYIALRTTIKELTFIDKFWCSLPIFSSLITTDRCIIRRIINLITKNKLK